LLYTQRRKDPSLTIMTTHLPRKAYTTEELAQLYPKELELQLVQVVSHHVLPDMVNRTTKGANRVSQLLRHGSLSSGLILRA
jgi:hypothetical protein